MDAVISWVGGVVWSPALVYLLLIVSLVYSVYTRFVQVRLFKHMFSLLRLKKDTAKGISSFQALAVTLSGRVGTGNIAGVAAAIGFGGPGAVFWMWVVAFLGAATSYIECTLGQIYKENDRDNIEYRGGPAYYIEKALNWKWFAILFSVVTLASVGIFLPGVQANGIANAFQNAFGGTHMMSIFGDSVTDTQLWAIIFIVVVLAIIIIGGIKRIAKFAQIVVPFMALAYILLSLTIIISNITELPRVIGLIVGDAFAPMAGLGAVIGWGVKRGVYSNEAGQGTAPHASAAANVEHPAQQGLVQALSVYIDTLLVCSSTAFMILITGSYNVKGVDGGFVVQNLAADISANGPAFTQTAIETVLPGTGAVLVAFALLFFAFTTILAYYYMAETNLSYLMRNSSYDGKVWLFILKIILIVSVFYGGVKSAELAWELGDIGVGLMAWVNIIALIIITFKAKPALRALKDYEAQRAQKVSSYSFDPKSLGIEGATFWEDKLEQKKISKS